MTDCRSLKALVSLLFLAIALTARADYLLANVVAVHDGDTITVTLGGSAATHGKPRFVRVRLNGIDAPELAQPYGLASRDHLAAAVLKQTGHPKLCFGSGVRASPGTQARNASR